MLLQLVGEAAFLVMFYGIESSSRESWLERGQFFALIDFVSLNNQVYLPVVKVKQFIFKRTFHHFLQKLHNGTSTDSDMENIMYLMRLVYDTVVLDNSVQCNQIITEDLMDILVNITDLLNVFGEEGWSDISVLMLAIMLVCCKSGDFTLRARSTAKLHGIIQNRALLNTDELCYLLVAIDASLQETLQNEDEDFYSFLIPVVRALLEKILQTLNAKRYLQNMPLLVNAPAFYENFQKYAFSLEWKKFIEKIIKPHSDSYCVDHLKPVVEFLNSFWTEAHEATMVTKHKREREKGESKMRFHSAIIDPVRQRQSDEKIRFSQTIAKINNTNLASLKRWRLTKLHLYGALNGPWYKPGAVTFNLHWKLSTRENLLRMRPKLVLNSNFDPHREARYVKC